MTEIKIADVMKVLKRFLMKFNKLEEKEAEEFLLNMTLEEIFKLYSDLIKLVIIKEAK